MATIHCEDCGAERKSAPSNTRYCVPCRFLRNVEYWAAHPRKCGDCKDKFAPVDRADYYCGPCNLGYSGWRGHCKLCQTDDVYLVHKDIAVCKDCARDPKQRRTLIAGLRKGQAARKQNGGTP